MLNDILVAAMRYAPLSGAALLLGLSGAAAADPPRQDETSVAADSAAPDSSDSGKLRLEAVDLATLGDQRARQGVSYTQLGKVDAQIDLRDNQVHGGVSGDNVLGKDVFEGAQGISTIIQNTGHNVAIQESLIINIAVSP